MVTKENIERLIEFGGLLVYEITWFDPVMWKDNLELRTFNEDFAVSRFDSMKKNGMIVKMNNYFVKFDQAHNALAKPPGAALCDRSD